MHRQSHLDMEGLEDSCLESTWSLAYFRRLKNLGFNDSEREAADPRNIEDELTSKMQLGCEESHCCGFMDDCPKYLIKMKGSYRGF